MTKNAPSNSSYLAWVYLNFQWEPPRAKGNAGKWVFVTPKIFQKKTDFNVKKFLISNFTSLVKHLSPRTEWTTIGFILVLPTLAGCHHFLKMVKFTVFSLKTQMAVPCLQFWSQSQSLYCKVFTRIGTIDFGIKLKITSQNFIQ